MARDLIPPLSPAGRPAPEGSVHLESGGGTPRLIELPPEPPRSGAEPPQQGPPPGPSQFRNRFGFLLGALAGVFIAAALVLVVVASSSGNDATDPGLEPHWSDWQPSDTSVEGGTAEIAKHVGAQYTHPDGKQLVQITGEELPSVYSLTLRPASGPIEEIDGTRVFYKFDGLGPNGSIKGGTPSTERLKVIHREALELALYTFRYLPDVESVVTLLPPPPPTEKEQQAAAQASAAAAATGQAAATPPAPQSALFYRPGDLKPQLQVPLGATLSTTAPNTDTFAGPEADTVETLTTSNQFALSEPQPGSLVLDR